MAMYDYGYDYLKVALNARLNIASRAIRTYDDVFADSRLAMIRNFEMIANNCFPG